MKTVEISLDYEVPIDYNVGELTTYVFPKKGKQAHEFVTKVLLPKNTLTWSCSKFERVFIYAIIKGMSINWLMAILHRFLKSQSIWYMEI